MKKSKNPDLAGPYSVLSSRASERRERVEGSKGLWSGVWGLESGVWGLESETSVIIRRLKDQPYFAGIWYLSRSDIDLTTLLL